MQIQINSGPDITVSEALADHLRKRLGTIEERFGDRLTRIEAYFADVNGPKGGEENKQCKLEARPRGLDPVAAEGLDESAYDAVNTAVERLEKVLDKRFGKLEDRR